MDCHAELVEAWRWGLCTRVFDKFKLTDLFLYSLVILRNEGSIGNLCPWQKRYFTAFSMTKFLKGCMDILLKLICI